MSTVERRPLGLSLMMCDTSRFHAIKYQEVDSCFYKVWNLYFTIKSHEISVAIRERSPGMISNKET